MFGRRSVREAEFTASAASASAALTRTAYLLTGNQDLADELVQESLARTYAAWERVRVEDASAYARRILVNLNIDRHRRAAEPPTSSGSNCLIRSIPNAGSTIATRWPACSPG